jgi:hypothetical protein
MQKFVPLVLFCPFCIYFFPFQLQFSPFISVFWYSSSCSFLYFLHVFIPFPVFSRNGPWADIAWGCIQDPLHIPLADYYIAIENPCRISSLSENSSGDVTPVAVTRLQIYF